MEVTAEYLAQIRICGVHGSAHCVDEAGRGGVHLTDCPTHPTFNREYADRLRDFSSFASGSRLVRRVA